MKIINTRHLLSAAAIVTLSAGFGAVTIANAAPITPTFDSFGVLNDSTGDNVEFGGDGISNQNVAITRFEDNGASVTLGLTATPRGNTVSPFGNDGAGTFFAPIGEFPDGAEDDNRALWNFSFFAETTGDTGGLGDFNFVLLYDFDPGVGTDDSAHGSLDAAFFAKPDGTLQDSQNLGFNYLASDNAGFNTAPDFTPFDPTVNGEYTFALQAFDDNNLLLGQSAIRVNVGDVAKNVPEPSSVAMLGLGLLGLGFGFGFRRRQGKSPANFA